MAPKHRMRGCNCPAHIKIRQVNRDRRRAERHDSLSRDLTQVWVVLMDLDAYHRATRRDPHNAA